jgi:hypothetical protein
MTDSSKLVAQQLRLAEIKRELERSLPRAPPTTDDNVRYGPCVLLSRECGSAGEEVARWVGERLHWPVYDREIVEEIAQRAHVRNQLVECIDERVRSNWRRLLHPLRDRENLKPATYLFCLAEIVLSVAHHGYAVIVGRGAQFLLPAQCVVRVRVVEPLRDRVHRVATTRQMSVEEATQFVGKREADRAEFIQKIFHADTSSPLNYDLLLNTAQMDIATAGGAVLSLLEKKLGVKPEPGHA